jgi:hypothetical protein
MKIKVAPKTKITRGQKLKPGKKGWRLIRPGGKRAFKAVLIKDFRVEGNRLVIFRILPYPKSR